MKKMAVLACLAALPLMACGAPAAEVESPPTTEAEQATEDPTTEEPTPEGTVQPGPDSFVIWARGATLGDRDLEAATADQLISIGNHMCGVLSDSESYGTAVQDAVNGIDPSIGVTTTEMEAWIRASVANLCPQHADLLP